MDNAPHTTRPGTVKSMLENRGTRPIRASRDSLRVLLTVPGRDGEGRYPSAADLFPLRGKKTAADRNPNKNKK